MAVSRRMARPLLASMFVMGGVDALMNPESKADKAKDVGPKVAAPLGLPGGSGDAGQASTVPYRSAPVRCSPSASCRGWRRSRWPPRSSPPRSPATGSGRRPTSRARATQRIQFFKNVSMLGGLFLAAVDTEGRPSLSWRAHRAAGHAAGQGRRRRRPCHADLMTATGRSGSRHAEQPDRIRQPLHHNRAEFVDVEAVQTRQTAGSGDNSWSVTTTSVGPATSATRDAMFTS